MRSAPDSPPDRSEGDINLSRERDRYVALHAPAAAELLRRDERVFLHQSLSTPCMNALVSAEGSYLIDADGRRILDFHGNSVHQLGHRHPRVVEAIRSQLDTLAFCPRRYTCEPVVALAERLLALCPEPLRSGRLLFAPGGALAVGIALKLARIATGRHKVISFEGAFHGASMDAASVGGERLFHEGLGPLLPGVVHVAPPSSRGCGRSCGAACSGSCVDHLVAALEREGDIGAVIAEPVRCTTVDIPASDYWRKVREACDRAGALLIFDEIPLALGRTGRFFCFEHFGVAPDALVLGKGLGGGIMPLAACIAREGLNIAPHLALGHYTHEKSPLAAAAGLATLDVIESLDLVERSRRLGDVWKARVAALRSSHPIVQSVRGMGLLVGVELDSPEDAGRSSESLAEAILYACLERGLSFKVSGGNVLTLTPPLTIEEADLWRATEILEDVLGSTGSVARRTEATQQPTL